MTRETNLRVRMETNSQDGVMMTFSPEYQRLESDFEISSGIVLPKGAEYSFNRIRMGGFTASRRIAALGGGVEMGDFFSGTRRELNLFFTLRPRRGVRVRLENEFNNIDLLEGSFRTRVFRFTSDTQFNPFMFVVNNVQFDTVSRVLGWQSRYRWTVIPGNDLFFIYTHNWLDFDDTDSIRRPGFSTYDRRAAVKFVYTRRF